MPSTLIAISEWWTNGGRGLIWDILPLDFAAGALWTRLRGVQRSVDNLTGRVGKIEGVLMNQRR